MQNAQTFEKRVMPATCQEIIYAHTAEEASHLYPSLTASFPPALASPEVENQ